MNNAMKTYTKSIFDPLEDQENKENVNSMNLFKGEKISEILCLKPDCYGTIRFLFNTISAACGVCKSTVCLHCKAIHPNLTCNDYLATLKDENHVENSHEELKLMTADELFKLAFETLAEGSLSQVLSGSQATDHAGDRKNKTESEKILEREAEFERDLALEQIMEDEKIQKRLEDEKELEDHLLREALYIEESAKSEEKILCSTPTIPFSDSSKLKRKRLFTEAEAGPSVKKLAKNVSSSDSSDETQDEEVDMSKSLKLNATYDEVDEKGKICYHCRACPYNSNSKAMFGRHLKSKRHQNRSANFDGSLGSPSAIE